MESDMCYSEFKLLNTNLNNSGLLRFRSAPSSLLANLTDGVDKIGKNSGELTQGLASAFNSNSVLRQSNHVLEESKALGNSNYALNSHLPPQYPGFNGINTHTRLLNGGGYGLQNSIEMDQQGKHKMGSNNLSRQNSSPAGLFSHLSAQNGYAAIRGLAGGCEFSNGTNDLMHSTLGTLSRISEVDNEINCTNGSGDEKLGNDNRNTKFYDSGFPFGSWSNSSKFTENFSGLKREVDNDEDLFSYVQGGEPRNRSSVLSHHLSLPKTSATEKLMLLQDSVPCKVRAKRGCATHPRSIAERVRRTKISERMRKLQELVPNMDKQANTADMLDLAVDYIKDLQKQHKTLSDIRANCKCSAIQKPVPDQMF